MKLQQTQRYPLQYRVDCAAVRVDKQAYHTDKWRDGRCDGPCLLRVHKARAVLVEHQSERIGTVVHHGPGIGDAGNATNLHSGAHH